MTVPRVIRRTSLTNSLNEIYGYYQQNVAIHDGKIQQASWWWHYLTLITCSARLFGLIQIAGAIITEKITAGG